MTQFDARMGFAPALLCIEEEPLKKTATVTALKPHPKQKEFDAFANGNHLIPFKAFEYGSIEDFRVVVDQCISIHEYMTRYDRGLGVHDELTFYTNGQERSRIFRGANDKQNKTATEIQLNIREVEQRMLRSVFDSMLTKQKCDAAAVRLDAAINGKPIDPKNVSLADVNAKLSELSGPTLKFKRFKPQLIGVIDWGFDPAKADES